jgi:hypothetical protein
VEQRRLLMTLMVKVAVLEEEEDLVEVMGVVVKI